MVSSLLPIGYEEESSIGQAIALQVVARYGGMVDQPDLVRYVNLVGRAVALTSDRPDIPYRFAILDDNSINAFAAPAGYIFVTRGLLRQVQSKPNWPRRWGMDRARQPKAYSRGDSAKQTAGRGITGRLATRRPIPMRLRA
ncbi:MAG: M48 family metalloprotease [Nitrospiraceae bacterium]